MTTTTFLMLLSAFSVLSGLITEGIKKIIKDKANLSYNLIALCVALVVGSVGCGVYYQLNGLLLTTNNIIYMVLMGLASGLCSMVGFDKFKQTLIQCGIVKIEITESE